MYSLTDICFLCLVHTKSLTSTLSEDDDGIVLEEKLKCFLIEYVHFKPEMIKYVCMTCFGNVNNLYSFRQQCLRNMTTLNDYFDKLALEVPAYKHFLEVKPENKTISEDVCMEIETKHEVKCEELDIEESDPPNEDRIQHKTLEVNIVVKNEPQDSCEDDEYINDDTIENFELSEDNGEDGDFENESDSDKQEIMQNSSSKRHYKCYEFDKTFIAKRYYQIHNRGYTGERPYECVECGKAFANTNNLARHKQIHVDVRPFSCSDCGNIYECNICQNKFTQPNLLKNHMRTHTGDQRFGNKSRLRLSARRKKGKNIQNYNKNRRRKLDITLTNMATVKTETAEEESFIVDVKCEQLFKFSTLDAPKEK